MNSAAPVPNEPSRPLLDTTLRRAHIGIAAVGGAFVLVSGGFAGGHAALGTVLGVIVALANMLAFAWLVRSLMGSGGKGWAFLALIKMAGLFGLVAWLLRAGFASVGPFALGYAALPIGVVLAQLLAPVSVDEGPLR